MTPPIVVLGAGAWGTALASAFARGGGAVRLWGRDPAAMASIAARRENVAHLPGIVLPDTVTSGTDLAAAVDGGAVIVAAVPAQAVADLADALRPLRPAAPIVLCAKGIERGTGRFPAAIVADALPGSTVAVLSGPSFAADVGRGLPTAVTLAASTFATAAALAALLGSPQFRLYHTDDVRGVEIGGATKNVLAIACGIAAGRGLGASAVAALTARAFAELTRFGRALGGRPDTLAGLSGLGDLVLTCSSRQSRNYGFGLALGRGESLDAGGTHGVVEGVWTAPVVTALAARHGVSMPICEAVAAVLEGRHTVDAAIDQLIARPSRAEG